MNAPKPGPAAAVDDVLDYWEEARERGHRLTPEELCQNCPHLLVEVRRHVWAFEAFESLGSTARTGPVDTGQISLPTVPGYEIEAELGRGGMGVVFKARQTRLNRTVALKMILAGTLAGTAARNRFRTEAEAVARLQHPNIVQVFEVGEVAGQPFAALEFVPGGTLAERLDRRPVAPAEAAALVETVARAVQHAHERGIVHRDLKPANILLAEPVGPAAPDNMADTREASGTTPDSRQPGPRPLTAAPREVHGPTDARLRLADCTPKVSDFGLAKLLDAPAAERQTRTGAVFGTPGYMAPEQARGDGKVGPLADVYALGAILYELLTGRPPFEGEHLVDVLKQVTDADPVRPRDLIPSIPRDLETVCLKCLEKEPRKRYPSAAALADDLRRFSDGEPVVARPTSTLSRGIKWAKRRKATAGLLMTLALGIPVLIGLLAAWLDDAEKRAQAVKDLGAARTEMEAIETQRDAQKRAVGRLKLEHTAVKANLLGEQLKLEGVIREQRGSVYARDMVQGQSGWDRGDVAGLRRLLAAHQPQPGGEDPRHFEWHYLDRLASAHLFADTAPRGAGFGPPEQVWERLKTAWDVKVFPELLALAAPWAFHSGSGLLALADRAGNVFLLDTKTGERREPLPGNAAVEAVAFSPDGTQLASGGQDKVVRIWDVPNRKELAAILEHPNHVTAVGFSPDGRFVTSWSLGGVGLVWDVGAKKAAFRVGGTGGLPVVSRDGKRVAAGVGNTAKVWDVATRAETVFHGHRGAVAAVAFGPGGQLATASQDMTVRVWNATTAVEYLLFRGHTEPPARVAFSADGSRVASGTAFPLAGEVRVWDATRPQEYRQGEAHTGPAWAVGFTPDGKTVFSAGGNWFDGGELRAWHPRTGKGLASVTVGRRTGPAFGPVLLGAAMSPDATSFAFAAGSPDRPADGAAIRLYRVADKKVTELSDTTTLAYAIAFSPDGARVAAACVDRTVVAWDSATGKQVAHYTDPLSAGSPAVRRQKIVVRNADGEERRFASFPGPGALVFDTHGRVAAAHPDGTISIWAPHAVDKPLTLKGHAEQVQSLVFSANGLFLASGGDDGVAQLWDAEFGRLERTFAGHRGPVAGVAFSRDGRRLATAGHDGTARLWNPATGLEVFTIRPEVAVRNVPVRSVAFRTDDRAIVTGLADGTVRVWDATRE